MDEESNEPKLIICEAKVVYKPKVRKICKLKKNHKNKIMNKKLQDFGLNLQKKSSVKSQNLDSFTFEEIDKDFKRLKSKSECFEVENELIEIIERSYKDISHQIVDRKVERPKNVLKETYGSL